MGPEEIILKPPEWDAQRPPRRTTQKPPEWDAQKPPRWTTQRPPRRCAQKPPRWTTQRPPGWDAQKPKRRTTQKPLVISWNQLKCGNDSDDWIPLATNAQWEMHELSSLNSLLLKDVLNDVLMTNDASTQLLS